MEDMEDGCYVGLWADCSLVASQLAVLFVYPHYWRDCPTSVTGCSQFCWSKQAPHTTVIHLVWPGGVLVGPAQWPGMICQHLRSSEQLLNNFRHSLKTILFQRVTVWYFCGCLYNSFFPAIVYFILAFIINITMMAEVNSQPSHLVTKNTTTTTNIKPLVH